MGAIAYQITSFMIVYSTVYSDADQRTHQSSALLAFVWGIHRGPVNSPHKGPVTRKMFPFDDVIMSLQTCRTVYEMNQVVLCGYGLEKPGSSVVKRHVLVPPQLLNGTESSPTQRAIGKQEDMESSV